MLAFSKKRDSDARDYVDVMGRVCLESIRGLSPQPRRVRAPNLSWSRDNRGERAKSDRKWAARSAQTPNGRDTGLLGPLEASHDAEKTIGAQFQRKRWEENANSSREILINKQQSDDGGVLWC